MMSSIICLPPEILLRIFRIYLQTETQYNLIHCISKVCRNWQILCGDSTLWQEFDGTLPFEVLKELCYDGILIDCKRLVYSYIDDFSSVKEIQYVYANLPSLNSVNFSNVIGINCKQVVRKLACIRPLLQEIVFNDKWHKRPGKSSIKFSVQGSALFKNVLKYCGSNLTTFVLSNLNLNKSPLLFVIIGKNCPNLEVLKVENLGPDEPIPFPTVYMQRHCQKLRIICLSFPVIILNQLRFNKEDIIGFKNLEIFKYPCHLNNLYPKCTIDSVIFKSPKLKELDISRCVFCRRHCLHPTNYSYLENLNISYGTAYDLTCFTEVVEKWSHSLKVLDISHMTDTSINDMFISVFKSGGFPHLTVLKLNVTSVTIPIVKAILQNCPQLRILNLESCSVLGEFSAKYESMYAVNKLLSRLVSSDC